MEYVWTGIDSEIGWENKTPRKIPGVRRKF
jgi:hypothetical protein